jgi:hypothetical protein
LTESVQLASKKIICSIHVHKYTTILMYTAWFSKRLTNRDLMIISESHQKAKIHLPISKTYNQRLLYFLMIIKVIWVWSQMKLSQINHLKKVLTYLRFSKVSNTFWSRRSPSARMTPHFQDNLIVLPITKKLFLNWLTLGIRFKGIWIRKFWINIDNKEKERYKTINLPQTRILKQKNLFSN